MLRIEVKHASRGLSELLVQIRPNYAQRYMGSLFKHWLLKQQYRGCGGILKDIYRIYAYAIVFEFENTLA